MLVNQNRVLLVVIAVIVGCLVNIPQLKLKDPMMKGGVFATCLYIAYWFLNSQGLVEGADGSDESDHTSLGWLEAIEKNYKANIMGAEQVVDTAAAAAAAAAADAKEAKEKAAKIWTETCIYNATTEAATEAAAEAEKLVTGGPCGPDCSNGVRLSKGRCTAASRISYNGDSP
jgi:hypothetical protein